MNTGREMKKRGPQDAPALLGIEHAGRWVADQRQVAHPGAVLEQMHRHLDDGIHAVGGTVQRQLPTLRLADVQQVRDHGLGCRSRGGRGGKLECKGKKSKEQKLERTR